MYELTQNEVKIIQDLVHLQLDDVTTYTPASLISHYLTILEKLNNEIH